MGIVRTSGPTRVASSAAFASKAWASTSTQARLSSGGRAKPVVAD